MLNYQFIIQVLTNARQAKLFILNEPTQPTLSPLPESTFDPNDLNWSVSAFGLK